MSGAVSWRKQVTLGLDVDYVCMVTKTLIWIFILANSINSSRVGKESRAHESTAFQ